MMFINVLTMQNNLDVIKRIVLKPGFMYGTLAFYNNFKIKKAKYVK